MPHTFFRLIHRARSRSQRRRFYAWLSCIFLFLFLLVYTQQASLRSYIGQVQTFSNDNDVSKSEPVMPDARDQNLLFDHRQLRRGPDMQLLGANDNDFNNNKLDSLEGARIDDDDEDSRGDLLPDLAPSTVHIIWCGKRRHFEFRHYLSLKRANVVIKPDKILFHYEALPASDPEQYYTWFNQTLAEIDHIVLRPLNVSRCDVTGPRRYMLVLSLLEAFGGIFIPENAILVDFPVHLRAAQFVSGVVAKSLTEYLDGIIVAKKNGFISPSSQTGLNVVLASGRSASQGTIDPCGSIEHFNLEEDGDCICVKVEHEIFPSDVWSSRSYFSTLARLAGYGHSEIRPRASRRSFIPKIAHYICWDCELKFDTYLSVMSALNVAGLNKVYIHGIKQPSGLWWHRLTTTQRVTHVYREYPERSHDRATMTQELAQGIMRVSILLKYGGVYCDSKVIFTSPIPEEYFGYDAVASPDWHELGPWPDSISHTTIMAKKNSEYLIKLRNLHSQNKKLRFWFIDQFLAYKIVEQNPEVLMLERHFQVKCLNQNCHPTWLPGYKAPMNENPPGPAFNWQNDTVSVYWNVFPDLELDTIKYTSGNVVEAARRVLQRSGVSIQDLTNR